MSETLQWLEALSYIVTIVGLPLAIVVFVLDRRRERARGSAAARRHRDHCRRPEAHARPTQFEIRGWTSRPYHRDHGRGRCRDVRSLTRESLGDS